MNRLLSSEMVHATTIAKDGRGVLIAGRSGTGKSDLALRLIDRGFVLVSDDQTLLSVSDGQLTATAPDTIRGKIEVRGIGIVDMPIAESAPVALWVELGGAIDRLPDGETRMTLGVPVPVIQIDAFAASAPIKVELALGMIA